MNRKYSKPSMKIIEIHQSGHLLVGSSTTRQIDVYEDEYNDVEMIDLQEYTLVLNKNSNYDIDEKNCIILYLGIGGKYGQCQDNGDHIMERHLYRRRGTEQRDGGRLQEQDGDVLRVYVTVPADGGNFKIVYKGDSNGWTETMLGTRFTACAWHSLSKRASISTMAGKC